MTVYSDTEGEMRGVVEIVEIDVKPRASTDTYKLSRISAPDKGVNSQHHSPIPGST